MTENFYNVLDVDDNLETESEVDTDYNVSEKKQNKKKNFDYFPKKSNWTYERRDKKNHKKILCQNVIISGICTYADRCLYAHKLDEQKIDLKRKKIFELLDSTSNLNFIDYNKHNDFYKEFLLFTKFCQDCLNSKCTGGYNCKFGAPSINYIICYDHLNYGICDDKNCERIHLSKRGLKPLYNNISSTLNFPSIDNINMLKPVINNLITSYIFQEVNYNSFYEDLDYSDEECEKSIFNSKYDLLDKD